MKVALLHYTVNEFDCLTCKSLRQPVDDRAAHLILCAHGIDDLAADVSCDPYLVHPHIGARNTGIDITSIFSQACCSRAPIAVAPMCSIV